MKTLGQLNAKSWNLIKKSARRSAVYWVWFSIVVQRLAGSFLDKVP